MARYELTDAIDRGDPSAALGVLHRMTDAGGLSAVEVLFSLHRHYANMLALDGATISSGEEAAQLLAVNSAFVGKKALEQSRRLGSARIGQAIELLAVADLDVKGATGLPAELVVEILVARLSRQTRQNRPRSLTGRGPSLSATAGRAAVRYGLISPRTLASPERAADSPSPPSVDRGVRRKPRPTRDHPNRVAHRAVRQLNSGSRGPCHLQVLTPVFPGQLLHNGRIAHKATVRRIADIMSP